MKKIVVLGAMLLVAVMASATPFAVTVNTSAGLTSSVAGATTITFNSAPLMTPFSPYVENGVVYSGTFGFYQGSVDGFHRAPTGDSSTYISVPRDDAGTSASYTISGFGPGTNYFGLYWGSLDNYNSITFHSASGDFAFTGTDLQNLTGVPFDCPPCGQPAASSFFNFFSNTPITSITVSSSSRALETDNHAFGHIPEPASLFLLGLGLVGVGKIVRLKR
jgi:PEP-CTERM motif-containing protein